MKRFAEISGKGLHAKYAAGGEDFATAYKH